jgi:Kef-type K+ transport system membrane component KefB
MIFFAVTGLGVELDSLITNTSEDLAVGLVMAAMFSVGGYFLARSGYRRHLLSRRLSVEEQLRASVASTSPDRFGAGGTPAADETVTAGSFDRGRR